MTTSNKFSVVGKADNSAEITLYDVIDRFWGISASDIYGRLKNLGDVKHITVRINSPGGSVFEGTAIYNLLKMHSAKVTVIVDGIAASMASVVAMAGDVIQMGEGAYLMIHDPVSHACGATSDEMRDMADLLDKIKSQIVGIYSRRTGKDEKAIAKLMKAETWMTTDEAIGEGFADQSVKGLKIAAVASTAIFNRVPEALLTLPNKEPEMADQQPEAATVAQLKKAFPKSTAEWREATIEINATMIDAAIDYAQHVQNQADAKDAALAQLEADKATAEAATAEAKAELDKAKAKKPGVDVLGAGGVKVSDDPVAEFKSAVAEKVKEGLNRVKATASVVRENPELHAAFIAASQR